MWSMVLNDGPSSYNNFLKKLIIDSQIIGSPRKRVCLRSNFKRNDKKKKIHVLSYESR